MSTIQPTAVQPKIHGTSKYMSPGNATLIAEAEFQDFAPACCSLFACLIPDDQKVRTYARVYENKLEVNYPIAPFCCLTTELCIGDRIQTFYFDKPPSRSGLCCGVVPMTCLGPPVIFSSKPKCFSFDLTWLFGEKIRSSPCNCFGLKAYLCCGNPCYVRASAPLLTGLKDSDVFLSAFKQAVDAYRYKHGLSGDEMAVFQDVNDNLFEFGRTKEINAGLGGGAAEAQTMGRQEP
jgi:hypothetical protein